jgi:hypothetical protein
MNCAEVEILLCEYVDGTLPAVQKAAVESHLSACPACAGLARDAAGAVAFMERAADVEVPPELVTRLLFDPPWGKANPATPGVASRLAGWLRPVRQPRFALGMAMTILSFSMVWRFVAPVRQLQPDDLRPSKVWAAVEDRGARAWARTVKFYENLRFVYQIQSTLREWQQQQDEEQRLAAEQDTAKADERKLKIEPPPASVKPEGAGETP